ncbi:MAG TPA: hypothetical protein VEH31_22410 [Streptosporangiaceae bacterium]|nr:hypothetical protein [Streptosporangiaceae bacterium]
MDDLAPPGVYHLTILNIRIAYAAAAAAAIIFVMALLVARAMLAGSRPPSRVPG